MSDRKYFGFAIAAELRKDKKKIIKFLSIHKDSRKFYPMIWSFESAPNEWILFFNDKVEAERFYDVNEEEIHKAAVDTFGDDAADLTFAVVDHKPVSFEIRTLNDFKQPSNKSPMPLSYICMRLYDTNPDVSEMRYLCINKDGNIEFHREFGLVKIFRNDMECRKFYDDNMDKIINITEYLRLTFVYKHADILIAFSKVVPEHFKRLEVLPDENE